MPVDRDADRQVIDELYDHQVALAARAVSAPARRR